MEPLESKSCNKSNLSITQTECLSLVQTFYDKFLLVWTKKFTSEQIQKKIQAVSIVETRESRDFFSLAVLSLHLAHILEKDKTNYTKIIWRLLTNPEDRVTNDTFDEKIKFISNFDINSVQSLIQVGKLSLELFDVLDKDPIETAKERTKKFIARNLEDMANRQS